MSDAAEPVEATERWLREFVIGLELCPFAAGPMAAGRVRIVESTGEAIEEMLAELLAEIAVLRSGEATTSLLVVPTLLADWDEFQDVLAFAEDLLVETRDDDFVQLVGFHPDYVFADAPLDDPAHATNRSPLPTLHLLKRDEVAAAVAGHPDIESIPARNVALLREMAKG